MKQSLKDQVAVITGAGGGIGRAVAQMLAKEGMKIVLLGGNNLDNLKGTERKVRQYGDCLTIAGDLTDVSRFGQYAQQIAQTLGAIHVLINNAGIAMNSPFENVTVEQYDRIMNINAKVPYFLTQAMLPYLKDSGCGTVINIASVVAHAGYPCQSAYVASKHAVLGFTKSLAREVYRENVRVHAICPGGVYTDMVKIARPDLTSEGMILPEEIAEIVQFLLTHRGNGVIDEIGVHRLSKEPFLI